MYNKRLTIQKALSMQNIGFIGAGNMASSIIGGLLSQNIAAENIRASDPNPEALAKLSKEFGIACTSNNQQLCKQSQLIVLAVKPQVMKAVAETLQGNLDHKPLIISIAAGITTQQLHQWLGGEKQQELAIVRCMPNTPALVQLGASGLFANIHVNEPQKENAQTLLDAVGISIWLEDESQLDTVTAVSGSGPAYFFLLMEAMINAGTKMGLSEAQARQLTLQTALGAASLADKSECDISELRRRVTSPGGTTEQALHSFENNHFHKIVSEAMEACEQRSKQMSEALS